MNTVNDFWSNSSHKMVADMLQRQQTANKLQKVSADFAWHRVVYTKAITLLAKTQALPTDEAQKLWPEAREDLLDIWGAGLSLSIQQWGVDLEGARFETIVETVTRRIEIAQEKALPGNDILEQIALGIDGLVKAAAGRRFSFNDFFAIAHALDRDELLVLHRAFMSHCQAPLAA